MDMQTSLSAAALHCLAASGLPRIVEKRCAGDAAILSFHRVDEPGRDEFALRSLSVTPENFRHLLQQLIERQYRFATMSELVERLRTSQLGSEKIVCLTFDDGFADNYTRAFPICRALGVPMTVYLVSGMVTRSFPMWSFGLEAVFAASDVLIVNCEGQVVKLEARTPNEKHRAYAAIAARFVLASPARIREMCDELGSRYGIDFMALGERHALTPAMVREMQASGLVEFGAHSVHHARLSCLGDEAARWEIEASKRDCETLTGSAVRHFAYPYGDGSAAGPREAAYCQELGFESAVTTECNTIFPSDRARLWALPRLTYNGNFQDINLLDLLLSGALPLLRRCLHR